MQVLHVEASFEVEIVKFLLIFCFLWKDVVLLQKMDKFLVVYCLAFVLDSIKTGLHSSKLILPGVVVKDNFEIHLFLIFD